MQWFTSKSKVTSEKVAEKKNGNVTKDQNIPQYYSSGSRVFTGSP